MKLPFRLNSSAEGDSALVTAAVVASLTLVACGAAPDQSAATGVTDGPAVATQGAAPSDSHELPAASASPSAAACEPTTDDDAACQIVLATANIFGAGRDEAPAPGEGGAGTLPSMWAIPAGAARMAVPSATGLLRATPVAGLHGPGGDLGWATDINSFNGISGIVHRKNAMFLVGVFLTDDTPREGEHPDRLGFTDKEDFTELAPEIGQTFFIGDGVGRTYIVPSGASRLFLGIADAFDFKGDPGWYGNNSGQLAVTVSFSEE